MALTKDGHIDAFAALTSYPQGSLHPGAKKDSHEKGMKAGMSARPRGRDRRLASFAAAAIAGSRPMETAVDSARVGIAKYPVPFVFVYGPSLLFVGPL